MRVVMVLVSVLLSGCAAAPGLTYEGEIRWTDPAVVSVSIDGNEISSGFLLERTFDNLADATRSSTPVDVVTTAGPMTFTLVPSACGSCPNIDPVHVDYERDVWELDHALERWSFWTGEGKCLVDNAGPTCAWIY